MYQMRGHRLQEVQSVLELASTLYKDLRRS